MSDDTGLFEHLGKASDFLGSGDFDAALDECGRAHASQAGRGERPEVLCMLGLIAFQMEDPGKGISLVERAHEKDPDCRDYVDALAVMNAKVGKLADSLYFAKLAIALETHAKLTQLIPEAFRNYQMALEQATPSSFYVNARIHFDKREYEIAVEHCAKELRLNRGNIPCLVLMGKALLKLGKYDEAEVAFHQAMEAEPGDAFIVADRAESLFHLGRFDEGLRCCRRVLEMAPESPQLILKAEALAGFLPGKEADSLAGECRKQNRRTLAGLGRVDLGARNMESAKIRVGYLSDHFHDSQIAKFFSSFFGLHDKNRFEIYGYQQNATTDFVTTQLKSASTEWRKIHDVDDDTMAHIIAGDGLDILVDLCSYVDDQRLGLVAQGLAPVVAGWVSWPNGAGLGLYDFVVSDRVCQRADEAEGKGEKVVLNAAGLVVIDAETATLDYSKTDRSPATESGFVTFGGICDLARINEDVAGVWAGVLDAVPDSRLFLGNAPTILAIIEETARELFGRFGVADRVSFQSPQESEKPSQEFLSQTDIILDTFPVNGTRNTCEALLSGVPVVTLAGTRRPALMGASILHSAGREEWVATTADGFVKTATALAGDISRLAEIRQTLRGQLAKSRLCDCATFTRELEDVYRRMLKEGRSRKKVSGKKRPAKKGTRKKK